MTRPRPRPLQRARRRTRQAVPDFVPRSQQTRMRCHRHPHGVQVRRTIEQLAKAPPKKGLPMKGRRNPKRCRAKKRFFANLLRTTKRLLNAARLLWKTDWLLNPTRLLNPARLLKAARLLNEARLLNPARLLNEAWLLEPVRLPTAARLLNWATAEVIGIVAVPRTAKIAATATIDLRIMFIFSLD